MPQMKPLGYGRTPVDISIQNWAEKLAKAYVRNIATARGGCANGLWLGKKAREMVASDPVWIEKAIKKVMGKNYEPKA